MKHLLFAPALLFFTSQALAQTPSPAQMGITSTTTPEVLQVLDNNKNWVPVGTVGSGMFIPSNGIPGPPGPPGIGETDILVTDPSVGMVAGGADNSPHVSALMNKMGPPNRNIMGYDVTFPAVPGQNITLYYFSQPLVLSRGANYHCSGTTFTSSTYLYFAPGIDGVIQEASQNTSDGGAGGGMLSGCTIGSLGFGGAAGNPTTPNTIINASIGGIAGVPVSTWQVGDGIIGVALGGYFLPEALLPIPVGAYVTAVSGIAGAQTLTISAPISPALGPSIASSPGVVTPAVAVFTQTGSNNFANNDTLQVGAITYKFVTSVGTTPRNVLIGPDFASSAANLVAAIAGSQGQYTTYIPATTGANAFAPDYHIAAVSTPGVITFTSNFSGPVPNTYPSVYSGAAGSFGGATFSGSTSTNVALSTYQLPVSQAYKVQTTAGVNTVTVISGPRMLHAGDVIWSDAYPFGSAIGNVTGTSFPITANVTAASDLSSPLASVTHAPGAEGNLWNMPAGLKRRVAASSEHLNLSRFPIGMLEPCSSGIGYICDGSRDTDNVHQLDLVGRWVSGNNYSSSSSINEQFSDNFVYDYYGGGTLGEILVNPNFESPESHTTLWGMAINCGSQQNTTIFGGYMAGGGNACADPVTMFPPNPGAPLVIGQNDAGTLFTGNNINGNQMASPSGINFLSGNDMLARNFGTNVTIGGPPGTLANALGFNITVGAGNSWQLAWNTTNQDWEWVVGTTNPVMRFATYSSGYTGYTGSSIGIEFPLGVLLAGDGNSSAIPNSRLLTMGGSKPTGAWHLQGDLAINTSTATVPGSMGAWYSAYGSSAFTGIISGTSLVVQQEIDATPLPTIAAGGSGYAPGPANLVGTMTGDNATSPCTTKPVLGVTASGTTGAILSVNIVTTKGVCPTTGALTWTPGGALAAGTGAVFNTYWELAGSVGNSPNGPPAAHQLLAGTGVTANTHIVSGSGANWVVDQSQTVGPITITGSSWYPAMAISNDPVNPDYTATTIRSGSSVNKDITGRITLAGGTATYTLAGVYATAPVCLTADATTPANASSVSESTTVLTFTGTGTDVIKYQCVGRN